jgi:glutamate carboxypeptidase
MPTDPQTAALTRYAEAHLAETLEFMREMVGKHSFTENAAGIDRLADCVAAHFAPLGFRATQVKAAHPKHGSHLVLERRAAVGAPSIALVSHLDTVFTEEEERRNDFHWRVEGTRIYGPGTNDIKGGTALLHLTLAALQQEAPSTFAQTNWIVLLNACEEVISTEFGRVARAHVPADARACLVFEADGGDGDEFTLVTARKGRATFRVSVTGRGAHAGGSHRCGANAIVQLAHVVADLARLTDYDAGLTVNVGSIEGGTVTNRVPHFATADLEMRAFDSAVYERAKRHILAWNREGEIGSAGDDPFRCRVSVSVLDETVPWPRNPATDALFALWQKTGHDLQMDVRNQERGGLSDGNVLWDAFPTLDGLGPRGECCHCSERNPAEGKEQEWVDVASFVPKTVLNASALLRLLGASAEASAGLAARNLTGHG